MQLKKLKQIPHFSNEKAERCFWESHCLSEYVDLTKPIQLHMPNLQASTNLDKTKSK
ncbi:MAG: hypothetical protein EBV69_11350 [Oxalobacteraceae bacterium]|nr:hypothetical protein [Oxalobacteraceae bacterium]